MSKRFDLVGFGEAMVRFNPPEHIRLEQAQYLNLAIAAAELNVCVNTSTLGIKTKWVSKLCDTWSGKYIVNKGREHNVNMDDVILEQYDGSGRKARNGLCFIEVGIGPRASRQIYDRGSFRDLPDSRRRDRLEQDLRGCRLVSYNRHYLRHFAAGRGGGGALAQDRERVRPDYELRPQLPLHALVARRGAGSHGEGHAVHRRADRQRRGL